MKINWMKRENVAFVLAVLATIFFSVSVQGFFSIAGMSNVLRQSAHLIILSVGMLFVLICGYINLAISAQFYLSGIVCAYLMTSLSVPPILAAAAGILTGALTGAMNGFIVARFNANSMITTLATAVLCQGFAYMVGGGQPIYDLPETFIAASRITFLGIESSIWMMVIFSVICAFILGKTYYGKYFYAVGSDLNAAERSGVRVSETVITAFMLNGVFIGVASMIHLSRITSAQLTSTIGIDLDVLTAAALGGVGFQGGKGKVFPVAIAALFLSIVTVGFIMINLGFYYQNIIKGVILISVLITERKARP